MQISLSPISVLLRQPLSIKKSYAGAVQTVYPIAIRDLYMAAPVYGTHTLRKEQKLKCRITRISMQSLLLKYHLQVMHTEYQALARPCV